MSKSFIWLILLFICLTTYKPNFNLFPSFHLNIEQIIIENNLVIESQEIKKELNYIYGKSLIFFNFNEIEEYLKTINFIDSFIVKKIYPNKIKLIINEKIPIAILQNKRKKYYISNKGKLINFRRLEAYNELPVVFGNGSGSAFYSLYTDLQSLEFPVKIIKSFYFFESGRWDLIMHNGRVIKLPIKDYLFSLENFMSSKNNKNFNKYNIFDYRIKDQLILK